MRPRKIVLTIEPNEDRAAIERFRISVWGYRALSARSSAEALRLLEKPRARPVDVVVAWVDNKTAANLRAAMDPKAHLLGANSAADEWLPRDISSEGLRAAIRRQARRRSGPTPRFEPQVPLPLRLTA